MSAFPVSLPNNGAAIAMDDSLLIERSISRIAELMSDPRIGGGIGELKERENALKKVMTRLSRNQSVLEMLDNLLKKFDGLVGSSIPQILLLQLASRTIRHSKVDFSESSILTLVCTLQVLMEHAGKHNAIKKNCFQIFALLLLRYIRPLSPFSYLANLHITNQSRLAILTEIPLVTNNSESEMAVLQSWGVEVFPWAVSNSLCETMERWVEVTNGRVIIDSGFFRCSDFSVYIAHEDVVLKCAEKVELTESIYSVISILFSANATESILLGCRLAAEIAQFLTPATQHLDNVIKERMISELFVYFRNAKCSDISSYFDLCENFGSFIENLKVINFDILRLLMEFSSYPAAAIELYKIGGENDENWELRSRFLDMREETRAIIRNNQMLYPDSFKAQVLAAVKTCDQMDWKSLESLLHAFSAMVKKFPGLGALLLPQCLKLLMESSHRSVLSSAVVCFTVYLGTLPTTFWLDEYLHFVLRCLSTIPTEDASGWFSFRSKQDNSAVVFIQAVSKTTHLIRDKQLFINRLLHYLPDIKMLLYTAKLGHSRSIFIKSISLILSAIGRCVDMQIIMEVFNSSCVSAEDMANFLSVSIYKQDCFPVVCTHLPHLLSRNEVGIESVIAMYCDVLDANAIGDAMRTSAMSPSFSIDRWALVAVDIAKVLGAPFVIQFSSFAEQAPINCFACQWFQECLFLVPVVEHEIFHCAWISKIVTSDPHTDQFKHCCGYILQVIGEFVRLEAVTEAVTDLIVRFVALLVKRISTPNSIESLLLIFTLNDCIGNSFLYRIFGRVLTRTGPDMQSLTQAVELKDSNKARRLLKKLAS